MGQNYSIGASFLNKHQEKEKIRSKEEADFVEHGGEIKTYKATKEEIDDWMEDLLLKKQGKFISKVVLTNKPKEFVLHTS